MIVARSGRVSRKESAQFRTESNTGRLVRMSQIVDNICDISHRFYDLFGDHEEPRFSGLAEGEGQAKHPRPL
jgi:hypothetical protein